MSNQVQNTIDDVATVSNNQRQGISSVNLIITKDKVEIKVADTREELLGSVAVNSCNHGKYQDFGKSEVIPVPEIGTNEDIQSNHEPSTSIQSTNIKNSVSTTRQVNDKPTTDKINDVSYTAKIDTIVTSRTNRKINETESENNMVIAKQGKSVVASVAAVHETNTSRPAATLNVSEARTIDSTFRNGDVVNAPSAEMKYRNTQYQLPGIHAALPPHQAPSMIPARHHAIAAVPQQHVKNSQLTKTSGATTTRNQLTSNIAGMNRIRQGPQSNHAPDSNHVASNAGLHKKYVGHQPPGARPKAAGQHHAAANAAEQHIRWRMNSFQNNLYQDSSRSRKEPPEIIDVDDEADQKDKLIQLYTEAIKRQLDNVDASTAQQETTHGTFGQGLELHGWLNDRKRKNIPEAIDHETHKRAMIRRQSLSNQNINAFMNIAFDAAISSDATHSTASMSGSGRRVDSPMTYLVRQLLGQAEIFMDEPAVVLTPALIQDASQKIRLVTNKLMEMIEMKSKKETESKIREVDAHFEAQEKNKSKAANMTQQKKYQELKRFADEKCTELVERNKLIAKLHKDLAKQDSEIENAKIQQSESSNSTLNNEKKSETSMRHLICKLDEGMTTMQRQRKEIEVLQALIDRDANTLLGKRDMISFVTELFGLTTGQLQENANDRNQAINNSNSPRNDVNNLPMNANNQEINPPGVENNPPTNVNNPLPEAQSQEINPLIDADNPPMDEYQLAIEAQNQEIVILKNDIEKLQDSLQSERRQSAITLKAYMRAAVHALNIQSEESQE